MGAARVEVFGRASKFDRAGAGNKRTNVLAVFTETTSTTATTAGSRIQIAGITGYGPGSLGIRVQVDEACYLSIGADPTAAADNAGKAWLLAANTPMELPVNVGDKLSFKDVA